MSSRKSLETILRQLEREKALLQHKSQESHRKAESEADRKRCLENEGEVTGGRKTPRNYVCDHYEYFGFPYFCDIKLLNFKSKTRKRLSLNPFDDASGPTARDSP